MNHQSFSIITLPSRGVRETRVCFPCVVFLLGTFHLFFSYSTSGQRILWFVLEIPPKKKRKPKKSHPTRCILLLLLLLPVDRYPTHSPYTIIMIRSSSWSRRLGWMVAVILPLGWILWIPQFQAFTVTHQYPILSWTRISPKVSSISLKRSKRKRTTNERKQQ